MITRFHVENYKALQDVTLKLTPIHVLIGANDSGKTSVFESLAALSRSVDYQLSEAFAGNWKGRELVWHFAKEPIVTLSATFGDSVSTSYGLSCRFNSLGGTKVVVEKEMIESASQINDVTQSGLLTSSVYKITHGHSSDRIQHRVFEELSGVQVHRWMPRLLALPVAPDSNRQFRMDASGFGLALCLDDILGFDRQRFDELEDRFRSIFPQIKSIKLIRETGFKAPIDDSRQVPMLSAAEGKGLHFEFGDRNQLVPASQVSDGLLLILAYLTIFYLPKAPRFLLIEEPENGIHPKRLQQVIKTIRELAGEHKKIQILLTTHSPYILDHFLPEQVTICRREQDGSVSVHRMNESEEVRKQVDVFTLGEIWSGTGEDAIIASTTKAEIAK